MKAQTKQKREEESNIFNKMEKRTKCSTEKQASSNTDKQKHLESMKNVYTCLFFIDSQ